MSTRPVRPSLRRYLRLSPFFELRILDDRHGKDQVDHLPQLLVHVIEVDVLLKMVPRDGRVKLPCYPRVLQSLVNVVSLAWLHMT